MHSEKRFGVCCLNCIHVETRANETTFLLLVHHFVVQREGSDYYLCTPSHLQHTHFPCRQRRGLPTASVQHSECSPLPSGTSSSIPCFLSRLHKGLQVDAWVWGGVVWACWGHVAGCLKSPRGPPRAVCECTYSTLCSHVHANRHMRAGCQGEMDGRFDGCAQVFVRI